MANTANFGWETPDDTDLVKDGAASIRTLGSAIDTSMVDLKGGTTGQILSKTSNTDMDFTWITNDVGDITAVTAGTGITGGGTTGSVTITNDMATTITAAGDIVIGTGSGTYDNLPIGTTGQVLTADTTVSPYKVKWAAVASGSTFAGCLLHNNDTAQTGIANNTRTAVTFSAELLDTDSYHSTSTNTSRITIPTGKGGKYWIFAGGLSTNQGSGILMGSIYKNGAQIISGQDLSGTTVTSGGATPTVNFVLDLVATDYIELRILQNSGGTVQTGGQYYFGAYLIGS
jgi:hypothetical protein